MINHHAIIVAEKNKKRGVVGKGRGWRWRGRGCGQWRGVAAGIGGIDFFIII